MGRYPAIPLFSWHTSRLIRTDLVGTRYIWPKPDEVLSEAVPPITHPLYVIKKYGFPETLAGTDYATWEAYLPKGGFTIVVEKMGDVIVQVFEGEGSGGRWW